MSSGTLVAAERAACPVPGALQAVIASQASVCQARGGFDGLMTFETIGRAIEKGMPMNIIEVFEEFEDWRNAQQMRHSLSELLTVAVCTVLSGADDFEDISQWGRIKLPWLRGFLSADYGIASRDTFA